jgi:hypothetical protein
MSDFQVLVLSLISYKLATLLVGMIFGVLGYKLFRAGVYEKAGDLKAAWGNKNLVLKQAAPGTFLALFGLILITTALIKGLDFEKLGSPTSQFKPGATPEPSRPEESAVINKVVNGQTLSDSEREILQNYFLRHGTPTNMSQASDSPEKIRATGSTGSTPKPK